MAEKLGQDLKLYVGDGQGSETFTVIAGQKGLTRDSTNASIDISSKSSGDYGLTAPGRASLTIGCTGVMVLPDAKGIEAVREIWKTRTPANFQIVDTLTEGIPFQASMYVLGFSDSMNDQEPWNYTISLGAAAAPTIDDLSHDTTT